MSKTKFTPGPWAVPHFADDRGTECKCTCIISHFPGFCGGIADIEIDNGKLVGEGGNDGPPLEEAKANAFLIAAAPEMYAMIEKVCKSNTDPLDAERLALNEECLAILKKARGE